MITYKTLCADPHEAVVPVELIWDETNPLGVTFNFVLGCEEIRWSFALDLLIELLEEGVSGEGDVRFVSIDEDVFMTLHSPDGTNVLSFDLESIASFVEDIDEEDAEVFEITDEAIYGWLDDEAA